MEKEEIQDVSYRLWYIVLFIIILKGFLEASRVAMSFKIVTLTLPKATSFTSISLDPLLPGAEYLALVLYEKK